jgi:hypothetical protein
METKHDSEEIYKKLAEWICMNLIIRIRSNMQINLSTFHLNFR